MFFLIGVPTIILCVSVWCIVNGLIEERRKHTGPEIFKKWLIVVITQLSVFAITFLLEKLFTLTGWIRLPILYNYPEYFYIGILGGLRLLVWLFVMKKWVQEYVYWVLSVFVIMMPRNIIYYWYMEGNTLGDGFAPIYMFFISILSLLGIWVFIHFQAWLLQGRHNEKQALKLTVIHFTKILGYQVILSVGLELILLFNNLFMSYLGVVFILVFVFYIRKKTSVTYIFWCISWLIVDKTVISLASKVISRHLQLVRIDMESRCLIGFIIYHILLTVYFKLKEDKK